MALATLIFTASGFPAASGPVIPGIDKVVHFAIYGLLATLVCRLGRGWSAAVWAFLATAAHGGLDEWHQSFVPSRSAEVADLIADALGAAMAVVLYTGWSRYRLWLERPCRFRPDGRATTNQAATS